MNATHDDQSDEPRQPGLTHSADEDTASPGLTRNKADGLTPGEILREGRLAHDYSIDDLCAQTKLSVHTVEALEDNDFNALSQPVFARGYYRQCAKVLDLDVERMMAAYTAVAGETPRPKIAPGTSSAGIIPQDVTPGRGGRFRGLFLLLVVAVVVVAAIMFVLPSHKGVPGAIDTSADKAGQNDQDTQTYEFNSSGDDSDSADSGNTGSDNTDAGNGSAPGTPKVVGDNAPRTGKQPGGRNVNQSLGINPPAKNGSAADSDGASKPGQPSVPPNRLVLEFSKRSWVRITDANGDRMASGIFEAGDKKQFDGKAPYKITLGFAPGVKMTIGGQPVDIAGQTNGSSIAHLTVKAADAGQDDNDNG